MGGAKPPKGGIPPLPRKKSSSSTSEEEEEAKSEHTSGSKPKVHASTRLEGTSIPGVVIDDGVLIYSLQSLFNTISEEKQMKYIVRCQYLEIYNDIFYDLLADRDNLGTALIIGEQDSSPAKTTKKGLSR